MPTTALYRLRLARGQSLRQLAADVGCSYQTIFRVENGGAVYPTTRLALVRELDVPWEEIIAPLENANDAPKDAAVPTNHRQVVAGDSDE